MIAFVHDGVAFAVRWLSAQQLAALREELAKAGLVPSGAVPAGTPKGQPRGRDREGAGPPRFQRQYSCSVVSGWSGRPSTATGRSTTAGRARSPSAMTTRTSAWWP